MISSAPTMPRCLNCHKDDFALGRRCQWCGVPFGQTAPSETSSTISPHNSLNGANSLNGTTSMPVSLSKATREIGADSSADEKKPARPFGWKQIWMPLSWLILILGKAKGLLAIAKMGKLLTTFVSMLVSIGFYALLFGWKFAVGLVVLLFIHEAGHALWIKHKGLESKGMIFIPFVGAAVFLKQRPQDPLTDAEISYAGPALGTLGAVACYPIYLATGSPLWLVMAHMGFFLNLFNLAPAVPLDGGWIVRALYPQFWFYGTLIAIVAGLLTHSPFLVIIGIFSAMRAWSSMRGNDDEEEDARQTVPPHIRTRMTALYLGLALFLGLSLAHTTQLLEQLRTSGAMGCVQ